jgi:Na+/proline symporter
MIGSGVFVVFQFFIFLIAGSLIFYFYQGISIEKDREFSTFIVQTLPPGLKGLLMAGILSAAMSTLSSSINSLASSVAVDWYRNSISLVQSKWISLVWAVVLISIALLFDESDSAIIIIGLQIASFTYGGLLGLFVLSKIQRHFRSLSIIIGLTTSFLIVFYLKQIGIAWTWFILIATSINVFTTLLIDYSQSLLSSRKR